MSAHLSCRALQACSVLALALALLTAPGCAWANRDNRPVWNAFEAHLVPEDDPAFSLALPLTIPGGLLAILADTFVVHPAQVVDDAANDAADLWEQLGPKFEAHYYTQMAVLPLRAVGTPIVFVFSFLGRSLFDIEPYAARRARLDRTPEELEAEHAGRMREWLLALAERRDRGHGLPAPADWTPELRAALGAALAGATTRGRLDLHQYALQHDLPRDVLDPLAGLADADPVFRYLLLQRWPDERLDLIPEPTRAALRDDPSPAVRELAALRRL